MKLSTDDKRSEAFELIEKRLELIEKYINDPFKAPECKYSLIVEIVEGKFD